MIANGQTYFWLSLVSANIQARLWKSENRELISLHKRRFGQGFLLENWSLRVPQNNCNPGFIHWTVKVVILDSVLLSFRLAIFMNSEFFEGAAKTGDAWMEFNGREKHS